MAKEDVTQSYIGRLKDTIRKNEKKIRDLEKQLKDHNENCVAEKNDLRRKIEKLERENDELRQQITTMKTEIKDLKTEIKDYKKSNDFLEESVKQQQTEITDLKERKDCLDKRVKQLEKKFEMSEDQLCIGQLLTDAEKNLCKLVLVEFYDEHGNHNANCMDEHIKALIKDEGKQEEAMGRWEELAEEIAYHPYTRKLIKAIKEERNVLAHPTLTEESIRKAKESLRAKGQLSENTIKAIDTYTNIWKQTKSKLEAKKPEPESANEKQARGAEGVQKDFNNFKQPTYASKISGNSRHRAATAQCTQVWVKS